MFRILTQVINGNLKYFRELDQFCGTRHIDITLPTGNSLPGNIKLAGQVFLS